MTTINTGPTATTLHHVLAALHAWTGLDPLWLLAALLFAGAVLATATCWAIERLDRHPTQ